MKGGSHIPDFYAADLPGVHTINTVIGDLPTPHPKPQLSQVPVIFTGWLVLSTKQVCIFFYYYVYNNSQLSHDKKTRTEIMC